MNISSDSRKSVRDVLQELRQVIRESVPRAEESISCGMPAFRLNGKSLVFFAAWKNHVGFYPAGPSAIEAFKRELAPFERAKGTIRFPLDKPIPFALVKRIVEFRVKENEGAR